MFEPYHANIMGFGLAELTAHLPVIWKFGGSTPDITNMQKNV
jgi:hypothetical protein